MLTPLDVENKKFSKQMMNGYSVEEVDEAGKQEAACRNSGRGMGADELACENLVDEVVEQLDETCKQEGEGKRDDLLPDGALR